MRHVPRAVVVALLALLVPLLFAAPAAAHGRGSDATNYDSDVTEQPDLDGVTWQVRGGDEFLQVTNASDTELVVLGYSGEPYLRIGPDGVLVNRNSEATYLNADRYAEVSIPPGVNPDADPEWEAVSDRPAYAWHDHRIHWMAFTLPPAVTDPGQRTLVQTWEVPFRYGDQDLVVAGELYWVPGSNPLVWLLPALLLVAAPLGPALRTDPDVEAGAWPGLARPAAAVLGVITLLNVIHLVDDLTATPIPIVQALIPAAQTVFFLALGAFGAWRAWQSAEGAFTALGVGSVAVFVGQGVLYFTVLSASQTASVFPGWLTRSVVALSVAQVLPLGVAAIVGNRRLLPAADDAYTAPEGDPA